MIFVTFVEERKNTGRAPGKRFVCKYEFVFQYINNLTHNFDNSKLFNCSNSNAKRVI